MNTKTLTLIIISVIFLGACNGTSIRKVLRPSNPYDQYRNFLQSPEFENAAVVREWVQAGETALSSPIEINLPYQEISHFDKNQPHAIYIEFEAKEGQLISIQVELISNPNSKFFIDLYENRDNELKNIQFAKDTNRLEYQVNNPGSLGLRVQPELFRGGIVEITIQQNPSLAFPISGKNHRSIASFFGVPRDGGRRVHEGIDVFAPRGTPITSVSPGRVSRVGVNNLGGKTVRVSHEGYSYYYAHLDSQLVQSGQTISIGDTLGTVGNTGNAISTAPHLHFGIYSRGWGAVDPFPFFEEIELKNTQTVADTSNLGEYGRVQVASANLRNQPNTNADISQKLSQNEIFKVQGKTNDWYRVILPDGKIGYLFENLITHDLSTIEDVEENEGLMIREIFSEIPSFDASKLGKKLEIIGEYQGSKLLRTESGGKYWAF
ncbi:M23 family metallopeptidase [Aquiflexum sp. TKW24L]|uniref:M23 family metallopeptidase n=1 Tax=Aquiflexum sp. TKW24L TaxID=2942212 RepID=UPI0020BDDE05|nr:M23 family metallopeptidase [Aquiflexum sp. TKW24L]MCL6261620.1 M23 family metallopeptidase [Aquiflexum sp. TKW24L]